LPINPAPGNMYFLDSKTLQKKWKSKDKYNYLPRKNKKGFREDFEKLKI